MDADGDHVVASHPMRNEHNVRLINYKAAASGSNSQASAKSNTVAARDSEGENRSLTK